MVRGSPRQTCAQRRASGRLVGSDSSIARRPNSSMYDRIRGATSGGRSRIASSSAFGSPLASAWSRAATDHRCPPPDGRLEQGAGQLGFDPGAKVIRGVGIEEGEGPPGQLREDQFIFGWPTPWMMIAALATTSGRPVATLRLRPPTGFQALSRRPPRYCDRARSRRTRTIDRESGAAAPGRSDPVASRGEHR